MILVKRWEAAQTDASDGNGGNEGDGNDGIDGNGGNDVNGGSEIDGIDDNGNLVGWQPK